MHLEANFDSPKKPGKPANSTSAFSLNPTLMLLLLLSRFSRFQLCTTPETAAHQAPPSLGFSRQEQWSGLPLTSPNMLRALTDNVDSKQEQMGNETDEK